MQSTGKLNRESNIIFPLNPHNHNVDEYKSDIHELKNKCKKVAKDSQSNLRKIFDDTTRTDPSACDVSFTEIESSMYQARRILQPKFLQNCRILRYVARNKFWQLLPIFPN